MDINMANTGCKEYNYEVTDFEIMSEKVVQ
jgi:hypothetical protein